MVHSCETKPWTIYQISSVQMKEHIFAYQVEVCPRLLPQRKRRGEPRSKKGTIDSFLLHWIASHAHSHTRPEICHTTKRTTKKRQKVDPIRTQKAARLHAGRILLSEPGWNFRQNTDRGNACVEKSSHCIVHANKVLNVFIFISISNVNVQLSESTTLELIMGLCSLMRQQ